MTVTSVTTATTMFVLGCWHGRFFALAGDFARVWTRACLIACASGHGLIWLYIGLSIAGIRGVARAIKGGIHEIFRPRPLICYYLPLPIFSSILKKSRAPP